MRRKARAAARPPWCRIELADALRREGFQLRGAPVLDGKWHRERVEGDRRTMKSGRYRAYDDGLPAGFIQNFRRGEGIHWRSDKLAEPMTDADRQQLAAARASPERERAAALEAATAQARDRWSAGLRVERHRYLETKGIGTNEAFKRDEQGG